MFFSLINVNLELNAVLFEVVSVRLTGNFKDATTDGSKKIAFGKDD